MAMSDTMTSKRCRSTAASASSALKTVVTSSPSRRSSSASVSVLALSSSMTSACRPGGSAPPSHRRLAGRRHRRAAQRQPHDEGRAAAEPLRAALDAAAVQPRQLADHGQPDAQPALAARRRAGRLLEHAEQPRQLLRLDAAAGVAHLEHAVAALGMQPCRHLAAAGRELERVAEQVPDDLLDAHRVGLDHHRLGRQVGGERHMPRRRLLGQRARR